MESAKVMALFKNSDADNCDNYRPISVLPTVSKIVERAAHIQLYNHLDSNGLLHVKQFGFRRKRSTSSALLQFSDDILQNMEDGLVTGVVFLDLKKAFDTVNHRVLLFKLRALGVDDSAAAWFKSYLTNRCQRTVMGSTVSTPRLVNIGVPQGSVLFPLFFLVYIDDLADSLKNSKASLFADDTALYCTASTAAELQLKLNEDLALVNDWLTTHKLTLNVSKTKLMVIAGRQKLARVEEIELLVIENTIEQTDSFKYLGVKLNETMEWSDHIDYIHSKVAKRLELLKRVKHLLPVKSREIMYNTMIQPILDYGDIVWGDCFNQTQMDRSQVLQNKAAKIILNKPVYSSSTSALAGLGWKTLKVRRQFHRSLFFFKCSQNKSDFNFNLAHRSSIHNYSTRSSSEFVTPKYTTNWGQSKSDYLFVKEFNLLSNTVKFSKSVSGYIREYFSQS